MRRRNIGRKQTKYRDKYGKEKSRTVRIREETKYMETKENGNAVK